MRKWWLRNPMFLADTLIPGKQVTGMNVRYAGKGRKLLANPMECLDNLLTQNLLLNKRYGHIMYTCA